MNFLIIFRTNAEFTYMNVSKSSIKVIYENNMVRIVPAKLNKGINFGTIADTDSTIYTAYEI